MGRVTVPRPPAARPGGPAPWSGVDAVRRVTAADVRAVLAPPGPPRRALDAAAWRGPPSEAIDGLPSAVLVPLFEAADGLRVVLTTRSASLTRHAGQVAFPGGRAEPGETLLEAALREAAEEVGLDADDVEVVGRLSPVHTVVSGLAVHPFVGLVPPSPRLVPRPGEVDRVFDVGLGELLADGVYREEVWPGPAGERPVFFFEAAGETVWGVTAAIVRELLTLVVDAVAGRRAGEFC